MKEEGSKMHKAWDSGVIALAFQEVGLPVSQKTTKTKCGKRVVMSRIDNNAVTCPDCVAEVKREADAFETMKTALAEEKVNVKTRG